MPATAQQAAEGGTEFRFGVTTGLEYHSNKTLDRPNPGSSVENVTRLTFGMTQETRTSLFQLDLGGELRFGDTPGDDDQGFAAPSLSLLYERESASSKLTVKSRVQQRDISAITNVVDPITDEVISVSDPGTRLGFSHRAQLDVGVDSPLGASFGVTRSGARYNDTISTSYYDSDTWAADAGLVARLNPVTELTADLAYKLYEADNTEETERETRSAELGLRYQLDQATELRAVIGTSEVKTSDTGGTDKETGGTYRLGLERELARGSAGVTLARVITANGARDELSFNRDLELPRGVLEAEIGVSRGDSDDTVLVASVGYEQELPLGTISFALARDVRTSDAGFDQTTTQVTAGWAQQVSPLSQLGLSASYGVVESDDPADADEGRADIALSLDRMLTEDWTLSAGVQHRIDFADGLSDARDNAVFLSLSRDFTFRR